MSIDYYNSNVRRAISDEYVKCSKRKQDLMDRQRTISDKIAQGYYTLSYPEYLRLRDEQKILEKVIYEEELILSVWDQAREICLNIADEMEEIK